jgi:hypothetical protein
MSGYRFWLQCVLSLVVAFTIVQSGQSQEVPPVVFTGPLNNLSQDIGTAGSSCKVYSLCDLGDDPNLCKWIAETIPEMIKPGSWKQNGVKLSFYAPSKILVVNHDASVHGQVDEFLQSLKKSLPQKAAKRDPQVLPAQFVVPDNTRLPGQVQTGPSSYPVPNMPQAPKHLFHFIIRYEGEGIIDSNVVKFAKALSQSGPAIVNNAPPAYAVPTSSLVPPPPPPTQNPAPGLYPSTPGNSAGPIPRMMPMMPPADLPPLNSPLPPAGIYR